MQTYGDADDVSSEEEIEEEEPAIPQPKKEEAVNANVSTTISKTAIFSNVANGQSSDPTAIAGKEKKEK